MQAILRVFKRSTKTRKMDFKNSILTQNFWTQTVVNCSRLFALPTPFVRRMGGFYIKISGTESCPFIGSHDPGILVRTEYAVYSLQADMFMKRAFPSAGAGGISQSRLTVTQFSLRLMPFLALATRVQVLL